MKEKFKEAYLRASENPVFSRACDSLRPSVGIAGIASVIIFLILPEVVAFLYGKEIATWAHSRFLEEPSSAGRSLYSMAESLFRDGGSWFNLSIGIAMLVWIWVERSRASDCDRF